MGTVSRGVNIIMTKQRRILLRSIFDAAVKQAARRPLRALMAVLLAAFLVGGPATPVFAQDTPAQNPPSTPAPQAPAPNSPGIAPVSSLGLSQYNFSRGPRMFPNILKPYQSQHVAPPLLVNSPRLDQLVHDNKLEINFEHAGDKKVMDAFVERA